MLRANKILLLAVALTLTSIGLCSVPQMKIIPVLGENTEASAQFNTALNYLTGQNLPAAVVWFRKAAENGFSVAQYNLAVAYDLGVGVDQDMKKAVYWYREAALQNDTDAQAMLAACLHNGEGGEQNFEEAAQWFKRAAELGSADAQYQIALYYIEGRTAPKDYVQAYVYLSLAASQGDLSAKQLRDALREKMTPEQIEEAARKTTAGCR